MSVLAVHHDTRGAGDLPKVFGRYLLLRRLSRGGMGEIFLAKSGELTGFEKLFVIKKILPHLADDREFIRRFIDEAQVAIKLAHANIAPVFEVGMVEGEYFLALEYLEGRDLRRVVARLQETGERLPVDLALFIVREVAAGLAYAHRRTDDAGRPINLVHCDISPPNVILSFEGEVKIIDFGIAKSAIRISETNPKVGFGKFGYMAPEQLVRGGVVDRRTDVYATGVLLYELLVGERLFQFPEGADYRAMARMVTHGQHPRPSERDPRLADLDELVLRAVAPAPDDRWQSAEELRDAVQMALVRVNPTLSADRLGSYMRAVFADEVLEEKSALAAARGTDISAFADALDGARTHTVSFAMNADITGSSVSVRALPDADDQATSKSNRTQLVSKDMLVPSRRRWPIFAGAAAACILGGVVVGIAATRGDSTRTVAANVAPAEPAPPPIIVTPMPPREDEPALVIEPEPASTAPVATTAPRQTPRPTKARVASKDPKPEPPATELTSAQVQAKVKAVGREYTAFKKAYGPRLDSEWNDILSLATFASGDDKLRKLDAKLDGFRRRMAEVQKER